MKEKIFLLIAAWGIAALFAFNRQTGEQAPGDRMSSIEYRKKNSIPCTPDWSVLNQVLEETDIPVITGAGKYKWNITTSHDSAQFYFNQGISMYYAFHIIESMASFKKAARFDPQSAMLQWAQALAYGPNINDVGYAASPEALATSRNAKAWSAGCTEKEKMLIEAQYARYSDDTTESREVLNQRYADKMKEAYMQYPDDADVAALYADALMLQHPWDLWLVDGTPRPWTPSIREVLEKLLARSPNHPGANHYYIHVMEPSPFAAKALPSADRMGKLTPGLSHTVHMPSHIYLRTGFYEKGVKVNEAAVSSYEKMIPLYAPVTENAFLYIIHNLHMQTNHAMLQGNYGIASTSATATRNSVPAEYLKLAGGLGNYIQYIYMTPVLSYVRFGSWNELLAEPAPADSLVYASLLYHFGKGMAYAADEKLKPATAELEKVRQLLMHPVLKEPFTPFSPAYEGATVAANLLAGTISLKKNNYEEAINAFEKAVHTEENMVYTEPRDWMLNPKHYLAHAYLQARQPEKALSVLLKDLDNNHENGWALFGCSQALKAQNNKPEADKYLTRYRIAFEKADVRLKGPVF